MYPAAAAGGFWGVVGKTGTAPPDLVSDTTTLFCCVIFARISLQETKPNKQTHSWFSMQVTHIILNHVSKWVCYVYTDV